MIVKLRKKARNLYYRRRFLALTSNDQVKVRKLKLLILALIHTLQNAEKTSQEPIEKALKVCIIQYLSISVDFSHGDALLPIPIRSVGVGSFSDSDCWLFFRFTRSDLERLLHLLRFPCRVKLDNRIPMNGEQVFLRGLYELASGENQHKIGAHVFGGDSSVQSRAFSFFINHVYENFRHLVHDNLQWWYENGLLHDSAVAIQILLEEYGHPTISSTGNSVALFIDCNCLETTRVGGGPAEEGANSARWDPLIQRAFYNGWKSIHGLKHQTVDAAHGLTVDMYGPTSLRRNDLLLLNQSRINERMDTMTTDEGLPLMIFGDSAYKHREHITSYINLEDRNVARHNACFKKVRQSIEWNYAVTASLFKYVGMRDKLKLLKSDNVAKIYTVATLFRNFHACLYGCQASNYFQIVFQLDFLEKYIQQSKL